MAAGPFGPAPPSPHQVNVSPTALDGRGIGRTTGRMCVRLVSVRVMVADMVLSSVVRWLYGRRRARRPRRLRRICSTRIASAWAMCMREGFMG
jgi:hypothetical protein